MHRHVLVAALASAFLAVSSAAQEVAREFPPDPEQFEPFPDVEPPADVPDFGPRPDFIPPPDFGPPLPPRREEPSIECDLLASPDYVPGIGVRDREVPPADLPTGQEVEIDTQLFLEMRTRNPQLRGAGVIVRFPRLGAPTCIPVDNNRRR
jgi:hypothetical protein